LNRTRIPLPFDPAHPRWASARNKHARFLHWLCVSSAVLFTFFSGISTASARTSPMCSEWAESIAAPPPFFPTGDDGVAQGCDERSALSITSDRGNDAPPRVSTSSAGSQQFAVLPQPLRYGPASLDAHWPAMENFELALPEHRWLQLRPPA